MAGRIKHLTHGFGGSRGTSMLIGSGWQSAPDWWDIELNGTDLVNLDCRARVECLVVSGEHVTPRVYNVTDDTVAGIGDECSAFASDYSGTNQKQTFTVTLAAGSKKYRLQGLQNPGNDGAFIIGVLEIGRLS